MRNSLALLGIPDLPIYAFRHVGDRKIKPQGGVASVVESASSVISDIGQGLIETAPLRWSGGGGILGEIGGAITDTVGNVSDAVAEVDDTVNQEIPGGWATVINVATAGQAAPYVQAAQAGNVIAKGGSLEDAAKGYVISSIASEAGGAVGAETGSNFAGNVAGGTTAGLLSGKSLEESVKGGVTGGVVSQATPSTLLTSTPSGTTGTQEYIPELNIGQGTPSSTSSFYPSTINVTPKNLVVEPIITQTPTTPTTPSGNLINETGQITDFAKNKETNELYKPLGTNEYGGNYVPVLGTQGQAQGLLTGQGTTGATNMAQEDFTYGYGGEGYQYDGVGSTPSPQDFTYGYGDLGYEGTGSAPYTQAEILALTPQTYGGNSVLDSLTPAIRSRLQSALAAGGSAAQAARNYLSSMAGGMNSNLLQGGAGTAAQLMQLQANREAAQQAQARIGQATQQAVAGAQFRPVGTTTRFGTSNFQVDPATGQLVSAGYTAAPEITSAQNRLMGLGASYLAQTPEEVAQQYMNKQYDLLDPSRQRQLAGIRNQAFQTGRGGLSVGSTGLRPSGAQGLMGANPEMEAYYNALAQQDAQLAAQAQQAGQQNVLFGTGLFGQAGQLETMAQQPFTLSQGLAEKSALGGARAGQLGIQGNVYGNAIGLSAANTTNPYATVLGGLSSPTSLLAQGLGAYFGSSAPSNVGGTGSTFNTGYYDPMQQQF